MKTKVFVTKLVAVFITLVFTAFALLSLNYITPTSTNPVIYWVCYVVVLLVGAGLATIVSDVVDMYYINRRTNTYTYTPNLKRAVYILTPNLCLALISILVISLMYFIIHNPFLLVVLGFVLIAVELTASLVMTVTIDTYITNNSGKEKSDGNHI